MSIKVGKPNIEVLFVHLVSEDVEVAYAAGRQLQNLGATVLSGILILAQDPNPRAREMACFVFGQLRDIGQLDYKLERAGVPVLVKLLENDPEPLVRAGAAAALGHQTVASTLPSLCRAAYDSSDEVRFDVAYALGSFFENHWEHPDASGFRDEVRSVLLRLMDDDDEDVRDWATFGIHQGGHDTPETRERLFKALEDTCPDVRGEAADGLAKFGDRRLIPILDRLLREDKDCPSCYFEAAEALGDPTLLPAVLFAADGWRESLVDGEEMPHSIAPAIEKLTAISRE